MAMKDTATTPAMAGTCSPGCCRMPPVSVKAETMPSEYRDLLGRLNVDQLKNRGGLHFATATQYAVFDTNRPESIPFLPWTKLTRSAALEGARQIPHWPMPRCLSSDCPFSRTQRDYSDHDLRLIIASASVLLILIFLLRAIVAPLYLIGSGYRIVQRRSVLALSCSNLLGQEMHWSIQD